MQATIDIIVSTIGERVVFEFTSALRITPNYYVYGVFVCENELEVMNIHEGWNLLTFEHEKYQRFVKNKRGEWDEVDTVQEYEDMLVKKLYEFFHAWPNYSEPRSISNYEEAKLKR